MTVSKQDGRSTWRFYKLARSVFSGFTLLYLLAVLLVMTPFIQTHVLYAHHIDFWWNNKFDHPEHHGLAPGKTVNLKLQSADNTTLGAWFIFADSIHRQQPFPPPSRTDFALSAAQNISDALHTRPTILFLHGNTGTRALPLRTVVYTALTGRLDANILAIDYRGFGDSQGHPSVQGVGMDARAGWDYLKSQGAKDEDVLIVGHSLGTAIAGLLAAELGREGIRPRGTVLMSPFSSVRTLIDQYYLFGFLPLLKPVSMIPLAPRLVTWSLVHRFDTLTLVPDIKSSVLIVHADDDVDIPSTHASTLFEAFLEPHLPAHPTPPPNPFSHEKWDNFTSQESQRIHARQEIVKTIEVDGFGLYEEMNQDGRKVALLKTEKGGHDIGRVEGVQDAIGRMFGFH
ncbi:Lysophosphatidylserine lipase ABHD12 [Psilocybe cubensis]|uniref:AB hydrolase-1 domain-containing protein n=2 Tax=Psilocybe cubensis TaxID=181762 RepID=A0A8H7XL50_PSICU|nr:Lysophosphatidylserine lipase ABHD12 [Psilocybe cubensis]KAH9476282.1 Lysophosphatidylserine lipase ABHD12 [Psilocybe cubensis]